MKSLKIHCIQRHAALQSFDFEKNDTNFVTLYRRELQRATREMCQPMIMTTQNKQKKFVGVKKQPPLYFKLLRILRTG